MSTTPLASVSLIPSTQSSGGTAKLEANQLLRDTEQSVDAKHWQAASNALSKIQSQIDAIVQVMRSALPTPPVYQLLDPTGALIAQIGETLGGNNQSYPGIWAANFWLGGKGPDTAYLSAVSGTAGITITYTGQGGVEVIIDPVDFIKVYDPATTDFTEMFYNSVVASAPGSGQTTMQWDGLRTIPTGGSQTSYLAGGATIAGSPGITGAITLTLNTSATGVFGTPGTGQSNGTVVTGATLTTNAFTGGVRTT